MMRAFFATLFAFTFLSSFDVGVVGEELAGRSPTGGGGYFPCPKYCSFPPHSVAQCDWWNPCGFTCKDGYVPFPLIKPTKCICSWPYTECNGKCGIHKACSSKGHHKRDIEPADAKCPMGYTACGILGRHTGSWECVNTQSDLESCGGCMVSVKNDVNNRQGQDCTAIPGVADVSCVRGGCLVKRCMPGYEVSEDSTTCDIVEKKKKAKTVLTVAEDIMAAEFGLEHGPL